MAGDGRVNSSKFKDLFHTKPSMIQRDQVKSITGFASGGGCPFNVPKEIPCCFQRRRNKTDAACRKVFAKAEGWYGTIQRGLPFQWQSPFLKPEKNLFLSEINNALHPLLLPEFEKPENGYYLPDISFPHTTLATRLNQK